MKQTKDTVGLYTHAMECLKINTVYLWGGLGEVISEESIQSRRDKYPNVYDDDKCNQLRALIGKNYRGFDCSGLIKNYIMGGIDYFEYNESLDKNSYSMYEEALNKGVIDNLPELPGTCLYMKGHVGIYAGNGNVIESTSNIRFGNGVVMTNIMDRNWENWFWCNGILVNELQTK